jgi:hypothetical protein
MKQWIWSVAVLCSGVHGAERTQEVSGKFEVPIGQRSVDAVVREALADVRSSCDVVPGTSPYLERLRVGPIMTAVDDGLLLEYRCIANDDPRLKEAGRDVRRDDAGKGILEKSLPVDVRGPFGWDMTYGSAFDAAGVPRNDTMRKLFRDSWLKAAYVRSEPDPALFEALEGADTAVLIDYQLRIPVYGGRKIAVFVASSEAAQIRSTGRHGNVETHSADASVIREFARTMLSYRPSAPGSTPRSYGAPGVAPGVFVDTGYLGVVSVSVEGQSRQFAITERDMSAGDEDANEGETRTLGHAIERVLQSAH